MKSNVPINKQLLTYWGKRREPWSSGYGWRLMIQRSWVRIPALYTGWNFYTFICCTLTWVTHTHTWPFNQLMLYLCADNAICCRNTDNYSVDKSLTTLTLLTILFHSFVTCYQASQWANSRSVWPDWAIFESSLWQIILQKYPKCMVTFGVFWNTLLLSKNCCEKFLGNFWKRLEYFLFQHLVTLLSIWKYKELLLWADAQ